MSTPTISGARKTDETLPTTQRSPDGREAARTREREMLARLGLTPGASDEEIEHGHDEIVGYLDRAPAALRGWATRQLAAVDEAYALLRAAPMTATGPDPLSASTPPVTPAKPAAVAPTRTTRRTVPRDALDDLGDEWDVEPDAAPARPRPAKASVRRAQTQPAPSPGMPRRAIHPAVRRGAILLAGAVAMVGIAFGGYSLGAPAATPAPSAAAAADEAAFQQQVAGLMQKLAVNPSDLPTLIALGNLYYQAQDYQGSADWMRKVLAIDPKHVDGLLAFGAASFNLADYAAAEGSWKQVLTLEPDNVEAYYDLGFLYFSDNPPKVDLVRQMWGKVVELAPDSAIAKTVGSHLNSLDSLASGAPAANPAPAGGGAPQASPTTPTSPAPSGTSGPSAPATSPGPG